MSEAIKKWQKENVLLSRKCRKAGEILAKVQLNFLEEICDFIINNDLEGFTLDEFLMKYGQSTIQLNHMLSVFNQLGS